MAEEIVIAAPHATAPALPATPMEMLSRALERGADLTVLEKLMDLQERYERNEAKKAFDAAIADAKSEIKPIIKNRTGNNDAQYADLGAYAAVDPIIAKHGLSYRYRAKQEEGEIFITCVLSHRDGYSEETTLSSKADATGSKNAIQALGSTVTYLQRYTLTLALGLAASQADDDGASSAGDVVIDQEQLTELRKRIDTLKSFDADKFCKVMNIEAIPDLRQSRFKAALAAIDAKVAQEKKAARAPETVK